MKKSILIILLAAFAISLQAQDRQQTQEMKTIFGGPNDKIIHGGYGAFTVNYSKIDGKDAVLVGGRGGWIINHHFVLGLAGMGFASDLSYESDFAYNPDDYFLTGGYGGLLLETILMPFSAVNISIPVTIGAGGATYAYKYSYNNWDDYYYDAYDASAYFVIEPGVEINLNVVKFMRVTFGGYYRYTSGLNLMNPDGVKADSNILNGFSGGLSLKFGKF
jgi:hypothetical protein